MGRHAQAARRGRSVGPTLGSGPPPAPTLHTELGNLVSDATGGGDPGGLMRLYQSNNPAGPWVNNTEMAWEETVVWGPTGDFIGFWWMATEEGNGVRYFGESDGSVPLYIE